MLTAAEIAEHFTNTPAAARDLETAILRHMEHHLVRAHEVRDEEMRFMTKRINELRNALIELVEMETNRYACASDRNAAYERARKLLEPSE